MTLRLRLHAERAACGRRYVLGPMWNFLMLFRRTTAVLAVALMAAPALAQDGAQVADGKYQTILGDCAGCHTNDGGQPYAGGRALKSPLGTFYTANITPDQETGIGKWTADDLWQALHDGYSKKRGHLYPAMPYTHYVKYSRADSDAIYAYLMSLPPVSNAPPKNKIPFPLSMRFLMGIWNALYFDKKPYQTDPSKSDAWNRGAYIVTGPGHCGDCHTPKNWLYADKDKLALTGNIIENWWAADLTGDPREGLESWSRDEIIDYLKTGRNQHLMAAGPMQGVIAASTSQMHDEDVASIATYLKDLPPLMPPQKPMAGPSDAAMASGRAQFREHCQDCHNYDGTGVPRRFSNLVAASTVQARDPTGIIHIILSGQKPPAVSARPDDKKMPAFAEKMTDSEIADVVTYIRNSWGNRASPVAPADVQALRKKLAAEKS